MTIPADDTPARNGGITVGYYDTDAARAITQNGQTVTYTLDPAGRRLNAITGPAAGGTPTRTVVRHYVDDSDNPGWVEETAGGTTVVTRYAESLGGDLAAVITGTSAYLALSSLHGDVVTTVDVPGTGAATGINEWNDYDEYGNIRTGGGTDPLKYGWVGAEQRSADTAGTGLLLMGARLYNPATGRFTSIDPVFGGNENPYNYPNDPINAFDLDGRAFFIPLLIIGARIAAHYAARRLAQRMARRAIQMAANKAARQFRRQGYRYVSRRQQSRNFAPGLEIHRRTARMVTRWGVKYGRASGPKGTRRRFSPDFRFGRGCYGNHGCIGVELKTIRGRPYAYGGRVR